MTAVLNPVLHGHLARTLGDVRVSRPGLPLRLSCDTRWVARGDRVVARRRTRVAEWGETYKACCPFCADRRFRLSVNHAWGTVDPATGADLGWLAKCYNEDCPADPVNRDRLRRTLAGDGWRPGPAPTPVPAGPEPPAPAPPVGLPPGTVPLHKVPAGDPTRAYLLGRGYDPDELGQHLGVGYCVHAARPLHFFPGQVVVPVTAGGVLAGFVGRRVDPEDDPAGGSPKWVTSPGMGMARLLYNRDHAATYSVAVVTEGVADVWRVGPCGVALFGLHMSPEQEDLLAGGWATGRSSSCSTPTGRTARPPRRRAGGPSVAALLGAGACRSARTGRPSPRRGG